ncbi:hypothetical protein ACH5RR_003192 [Cinchona calisaya]|uniref:Uncharacterized protein n=1 Tax=Cinchona calisaya TaxID=153742 RepID=A0ABD3AU59_9GENT
MVVVAVAMELGKKRKRKKGENGEERGDDLHNLVALVKLIGGEWRIGEKKEEKVTLGYEKHATELQSQVSQTFLRKKIAMENRKDRVLDKTELEGDEDLYSTMETSTSGASKKSHASL